MTEASRKPKRRLRFRLRTFLIVLTILCVWFGWYAHRAKQQRDAVQWVLENGGSVVYYYEFGSNGARVEDSQPPGPKWLHNILDENYFSSVMCVYLKDTKISDVKPLAGLTDLTLLQLWNTPVTDLTPLADLTNLQTLGLEYTNVSDEEIEKLKQALPNCKIHKNIAARHDEISAVTLYNEFNGNEVAANKDYKGKYIFIDGEVAQIEDSEVFVGIKNMIIDDGQGNRILICQLSTGAGNSDALMKIRTGSFVRVRGRCVGKGYRGYVYLSDCNFEIQNE